MNRLPNPDSPRQQVLGIAGSLRKASVNRRLLEAAAAQAPPRMDLHVFDGLPAIPLFNEDLEQEGAPEAVLQLRAQVRVADGLVIATPEYNQSLPGVLKNAIDWLSRPGPDEPLAAKPIVVLGASSGRWGTRLAQHALRQTLAATESQVMSSPTLFVRDAGGLFDPQGKLCDAPTLSALRDVLAAFAEWIERVSRK